VQQSSCCKKILTLQLFACLAVIYLAHLSVRNSETTTSVTKIVSQYERVQSILIWSVSIWVLGVGHLQATAKNSVSPDISNNSNSLNLSEPDMNGNAAGEDSTRINSPVEQDALAAPSLPMIKSSSPSLMVSVGGDNLQLPSDHNNEDSSIKAHYPIKLPPILIAAPENFNPGLRLPPVQSQPEVQPQPPPAKESVAPAIKLESITTDFRREQDNFGQSNQFIEQSAQLRLPNGNRLSIRTGYNSFEQRQVESITNIPLHIEWEGKIDQVTVAVGGGVDVFDRLPTALNFNAKVEAPFRMKVSPSGQLQSGVIVSAAVEQGPYKFNAQTLGDQITAWRYGPSLYWQIDPNTSLYSSLRLGNYNDGNFEQQSFSRLERKCGQFFVAANLFNWNYTRDAEKTKGYFSPPDFLVYNGEVGLEGNVIEGLRCRVATSLGQQRLKGNWDVANSYQARCTAKLSPSVEADFGYAFSNVQSRQTEGSGYNNQSFTGQLRIKL